MKYYTKFDTNLCEIILVGDENGLNQLHLNTGKGKRDFDILKEWQLDDSFFNDIKRQLLEYSLGKKIKFNVKVNPQGTDFQKQVWQELQRIPYGKIETYKDIAIKVGNPNASRAVGMANSKNPIPLIIPGHRVIGANGKLTGFALGLELKQKLIEMENDQQSIDFDQKKSL